jgi:predicted aspartyl protease
MRTGSTFLWAAVLLVASMGTLAIRARAEPCSLAIATTLVLQPATGFIPVRINDMPASLELDTGAFSTILTPLAAKRLALREDLDRSIFFRGQFDNGVETTGIGGSRTVHKLLAKTFDLGDKIHGTRFHFLAGDLGNLEADGLLSTDFLQKYDIDLDFAGGQIRLFKASGSCGRPKVYLQPPVYAVKLIVNEDDPRPRVHVTIDGHDFTALVDTGARHTTIYRRAITRLGLQEAAFTKDMHLSVTGLGPRPAQAIRHVFAALGIGDLTLRNKTIDIVDDEPSDDIDILLGAELQHTMHLWISNSAQMLIIQYPAQPSPPIP